MDDHRALVERWFEEVWNQGRVEAIDEMMTPDVVAHGLGDGGQAVVGRDAFKRFHAGFRAAFPDIRVQVEDVVLEGDRAAWRLTARATHLGDGLGIAPTQRPVTFEAMGIVRVRDGRIAEGWNVLDMLAVMEQCDALPRRGSKG